MWGNEKKRDVAKSVLFNLVDSLQKNNSEIEIGVRVFGHQSDKSLNDCKDSKLEIPFSSQNADDIKKLFSIIDAKGNTPIAYSLIAATNDFPVDSLAINAIILITDGIENCEGNPCDAVLALKTKRITINPYIIGLDIDSDLIEDFACIGKFVNAKDEKGFKDVLNEAVKQFSKNTSVEINLLSKDNKLISNTPITLYNHYTGKAVYQFIHALDKKGNADSIFLDPRGVFDLVVHTFPSLRVNKIELEAGKHNVINIPVLKGKLDFDYEKAYDDKAIHYVLRPESNIKILYSNSIEDEYFLADKYDLTVLTFPLKQEKIKNIPIENAVHQIVKPNGKLIIDLNREVNANLYVLENGSYMVLNNFGQINKRTEIKLQANTYKLVYISTLAKESEETHVFDFELLEGKTVIVN